MQGDSGKIMIAPIPQTELPVGKDGEIAALEALQVSGGWQIILRILKENIKAVEQSILDEETLNGELLGLRFKRKIYQQMIDTPKIYIGLWETIEEPEEEHDPYYKNVKDMKKDVH